MPAKPNKGPFYGLSEADLQHVVGTAVIKITGKAFDNEEKIAVVEGIATHPYTRRAAFILVGCDDVVEAQSCRPIPQPTGKSNEALKIAILDLGRIALENGGESGQIAKNSLNEIDVILNNVPCGDWRLLYVSYGGELD